jgi:DNA-binding SARP family transcriptional activator
VAAAVVVFAAVPSVLVVLVGLPVPQRWDRADILSSRGLFDLLAVMAWVAWVACCWPLLRAVAGRVRRRDASSAADARVADWLATRIAAAVLTVAPVGLGLGAVAGASGHRPVPAAHAQAVGPAAGTTAPVPAPAAPAAPDGPPAPPVAPAIATTGGAPGAEPDVPGAYTVEPGDTLWGIAERFYDSGADWPAIAGANLGHVMVDGTRFVDPSLILPGWVLSLPQTGDPAAATPAPAATAAPAAAAGGTAPAVVDTAPAGTPPAGPVDPVAAAAPRATTPVMRAVARHRRGSPRHAGRARRTSWSGGRMPSRAPGPVPLPELAALGVGVVVAAAFARRARRVRAVGSLGRDVGQAPPDVSEAAADTATLLAPFDGAPVLEWAEAANRHLAGALVRAGRADEVPAVQLVRVGPDGVEVHLAASVHWEPDGWTRRGERAWHLSSGLDPAAVLAGAREHEPWLPLLVPIGENDEGTWLTPVGPGRCLPVLGSDAGAAVSAMRAAVESWSWAERVVVTDDPEVACREAAVPEAAVGGGGAPVLFVGDPGRLPEPARQRCGVVTTLPVVASDLTIVVDARAASVHPLGLTLRPHLLPAGRASSLAELCEPADPGAEPLSPPHRAPAARAGTGAGDQHRRAHPPAGVRDSIGRHPASAVRFAPGHRGRHDPLAPGPVEVRLLTAIPRIDGLADELPPKRARRAVELVAYLALHHPDPVTSDRLRTRVLGSADADAAAKTLFNTAGAGRRAMGRDPEGDPYLPLATKSGHYRVSELVTVDAARAVALVAAAEQVEDPQEAMALQREALGLVEGEPLAGILTGYSWWNAEGHERRTAAALVDGACRLARRATAAGHLDLARWALERARLVEPYSEALSRVAMEVAAEAGDTDALRREWADCQRRVDELDPGGLPAEATERLYAELRRSVPASSGSDGLR